MNRCARGWKDLILCYILYLFLFQYLPVDQAPIEGYVVYHKPYDAHDAEYKERTVLGAATSNHLFTQLRPNTQYSIKMRCFNTAGRSDESNTVVKKTLCQYTLYSSPV